MKKLTIFISDDITATVDITPTRKTESTANKEFLNVLHYFANYPEIVVCNVVSPDNFVVSSQHSDISMVTHIKNIIAMHYSEEDGYTTSEETNNISQVTFVVKPTGEK